MSHARTALPRAFRPAAAALLLCSGTALAGGPGSTGVQVLKTDVSPRAFAMGGAYVAVADDVYAVNYNPAGLAQLYLPEASAMYLSGFEDSSLNYLAFGMPLPVQGLAGLDKPGLAVSALFSDSGEFTYNSIGDTGGVSSLSMDAEKTRVIALSYGEKVFSGPVHFTESYKPNLEQYLGLSVKYIGSELLETYSASAVAFDAGWMVRDPETGLALGAALTNFGSGLQYYKESAALPSTVKVGASYQRPTVMSQSLLLAGEADFHVGEQLKSYKAGLEYHFQEIFSFRLGYTGGEANSGATGGLGVRYENFSLDFGLSLGGEVYNASQVAFSYKFSGWRSGDMVKKPRQYKDPRAEPAKRPSEPAKRAEPEKKRRSEPETKPQKKDSDFFWIY
jgi:hypothetical protein